MKKNKIKLWLVIALWIAGLIDVIATFSHITFLQLESNPIYVMTGSSLFLLLTKLGLLSVITYFFLLDEKKPFKQYFWVYMVVLLIVSQVGAGINNFSIKEQVHEQLGKDKPLSDYTDSDIKQFAPSEGIKLDTYLTYSLIFMILPIFISFGSFKIWEWLYYSN